MIKNLKKAFTIIELVIVIAVIAILAAVMIPTYSSLVEKANQSADIQAVKQMNTILKADEATNGVPANVEEVKEILRNNNMSNYNPMVDSYLFSWDPESNTIILINKNTNQAEYPSNFAKKTYLANWELLDGKVNVTMKELGVSNLEDALKKIDSNQTIVLSADASLSKNTKSLADSFSIDLAGHTLTMEYNTEEGYNESIYVKESGNAKITNGVIVLKKGANLTVCAGAYLFLQDVVIKKENFDKLESSGGVFLAGDNSRCDMKNCKIETNLPVSTNAGATYGKGVILNAYNCTFGREDYQNTCGVWLNVYGKYNIYNSFIYAQDQCVFNRCGDMYIENTICNYTPEGEYAHNETAVWGQGNQAYTAPIVVGDWSTVSSYDYDANCILVDVKVNIDKSKYAYTGVDVFISQDGNNKASLTCDSTISWEVCSYTNSSITFGNVYINGDKKNQGSKSN